MYLFYDAFVLYVFDSRYKTFYLYFLIHKHKKNVHVVKRIYIYIYVNTLNPSRWFSSLLQFYRFSNESYIYIYVRKLVKK